MKVIIAGGRDYQLSIEDYEMLDKCKHLITEVVCGMARGVDTAGRKWAEDNGIPVKEFPADWKRLGKSAGHQRNKQMAMYADAAILFIGGKGTDNMYRQACKFKLHIFDYRTGTEFPF